MNSYQNINSSLNEYMIWNVWIIQLQPYTNFYIYNYAYTYICLFSLTLCLGWVFCPFDLIYWEGKNRFENGLK